MAVQLNHTIVHARDKHESATFLSAVLGLPAPRLFGHFLVVDLSNGVSLDFMDQGDGDVLSEHYAFLVSDDEFDEILARIQARDITYWPNPRIADPGQINHHFGGRGCYFQDPSGHFLEVMTRPYGTDFDAA